MSVFVGKFMASQRYDVRDVTCNMWSPATRHKWTRLALSYNASQARLDLPTPEGWKAELTFEIHEKCTSKDNLMDANRALWGCKQCYLFPRR